MTLFGKERQRMNSNNERSKVGILTVLQIVFIVLKLCKVITWSWWLVLVPLWINIGLTVIVLVICGIIDGSFRNKRNRSDRLKW